jgi:glycosyltransferase involved in cell wall biosynthesis
VRIAFVVDGALEQRTGGYLYDFLVTDGLRDRGDDVSIVSLPTGARHFRDAHRRVRAALARDDLDAVVIDELCHPRATLAAIASRFERASARPRLVTLVHHLAASERTGAARLGRLAVERSLLAASDHVIVTSATTRDVVVGLGVERRDVFVALPGCDRLGLALAPPAPRDEARFLFLGALTPRKDPLAALDAFARIDGPARLRFVGPTDRDRALTLAVRRAAEDLGRRVEIWGEVDDARVREALGESDVLLMPSRYEGFGIAAAEALAHGLLVIATRAGALPEVVREGEGGALIDADDPDAFARAAAKAASDRRWLEDQKARALAHAGSLPRWSETIASFGAALVG